MIETDRLKAAALYSGGKDSNLALWRAMNQGVRVECLISMLPESSESWMFHFPNAAWTTLQAEAMRIPIVQVKVSCPVEKELADLERSILLLKSVFRIDSLISGAIESSYQRQRLADISKRTGVKLITPLWKEDPAQLVEEMLKAGFDIRFVGVSALGLGEEWLGRRLDRESWTELQQLSRKYGIHLAGEGGEYETFVCESPLFKQRIEITEATKSWSHDSGIFLIEKARLVNRETYPNLVC